MYRHKPVDPPSGAAGLIHSGPARVLCLPPAGVQTAPLPGWRKYGPIYYLDLPPRTVLAIGPYTLLPDAQVTHASL
jgi:hypothetical protein